MKNRSAFIRTERRGTRTYYHLRQSKREGGRVRQVHLASLGKIPSVRRKFLQLNKLLRKKESELLERRRVLEADRLQILRYIQRSRRVYKTVKAKWRDDVPPLGTRTGSALLPFDIKMYWLTLGEVIPAYEREIAKLKMDVEKLRPFIHLKLKE